MTAPLHPQEIRKIWFAGFVPEARERLQAGSVPTYLMDALPDELLQQIVRDAGLPQSLEMLFLTIAVAYDLALCSPPTDPKIVRQQIEDLLSTIDKLVGQFDQLCIEAQKTLWDVRIDDSGGEDHDWPVWREPSVWDNLSAVLRRAQDAKADIDTDPVRAGRPLSVFPLAAEAVIELVEDNGFERSDAQLAQLIEDLLSEIRLHHHDLSRSDNRDRDELPRSRDVVSRIRKNRSLRRA